ncbi:hypothetical protein TNCV_1992911 [Trichonephila clavipes]|nr:hypothetical protein TNCV_1992911 [Trichonephila clavipes]
MVAHCALHHGHFDDLHETAYTSDAHLLTRDVRPIDMTQLTMNFNWRNALCIQELYPRPNIAGGGRRNKSFHFGPLLPSYSQEAGPFRLAHD